MQIDEILTLDVVRAWPPIVPAHQADAVLDICSKTGRALRRSGTYPLRWFAIGKLHKVRTADLVAFLEGPPDHEAALAISGVPTSGRLAG